MKFSSFDLEIVNEFPDDGTWSKELGISCAAVLSTGKGEVDYYYNSIERGRAISEARAKELVNDLIAQDDAGYKIVTWNGTKFDFRVLADASRMYEECAELAMNHLDMMLWVTFQKGYYLGLQTALKGANLEGKLKEVTLSNGTKITDMSGSKAPRYWRLGETGAVLDYLEEDVVQPLKLVEHIEKVQGIGWVSRSGKPQFVPVPKLWTVRECFELPEPDVSWMKDPPKREDFISWMKEY